MFKLNFSRLSSLFPLFSALSAVNPVFPQNPAIAVMTFANNSLAEKDAMAALSAGLAEMFTTELGKIKGLRLVERRQLTKAVAEMALGQSGLLDDAQAQKTGKIIGAEILLLGSFTYNFNGAIRIDTRLVKTETGETIKAEEVTGKRKDLFRLVNKLSFQIADGLQIKLDKESKTALKESPDISYEAALAFSQGLGLEEAGKKVEALKKYQEALNLDKNFKRAQEKIAEMQK
jgi:TolB-like protein